MLMSILAIVALSAPPSKSVPPSGEKPPCSLELGKVSTEGLIVAADVPRGSSPRLVFGRATRLAQPPYPQLAIRDCASGRVVILATVSELGVVTSAEVRFGSHPALDDAALRAVMGWRFTPTTAEGVAVPAFAQILFHFSPY